MDAGKILSGARSGGAGGGSIFRRLSWALMIGLSILGAAASAAENGIQDDRPGRFYDGLVAYNTGDFVRAAEVWRGLAALDDGNAESGLGLLYYSGYGVPRNYALARGYFAKAARKGIVQSQLFLGFIYFRGDGVPRNDILAYMWSDIGVASGYAQALMLRNLVTESMSAADIRTARRLSVEWQDRHAR